MKFKKIYIEITDICASNCAFCPSPLRAKDALRGEMDLDLYRKILGQIGALSKNLSFHILGDPLCAKNLESFVDLASDFRLDIVTLGKFLRRDKFEILTRPNIHQVAFSLSEFVRNPSSFPSDYLEAILSFCNFASGKNVFVNLRIQSDFLEVADTLFEKISAHFGVEIFEKIKQIKSDFKAGKFSKNTKIRLADRIFLNFKFSFEWRNLSSAPKLQKRCYGTIAQLGILSNGVVVPCCIDYSGAINLGDLNTTPLSKILTSPAFLQIRKGFLNGLATHPHCQRCQYEIGKS